LSPLAPRDAYRLWAPTYTAETAISSLDEEVTRALSPPLANKRMLDAGCGTGRRLRGADAFLAVGIDASLEMLEAGHATCVAAADLRALPFANRSFDVIWCRLVLGHLAELQPAYDELARVCAPGGHLLVSDFHPDAVAAGHKRSFRDSRGHVHEIEHHAYCARTHEAMASRSGFGLLDARDATIGASTESFYERAGRHDAYLRDRGLAVVAGYLFQRRGSSCVS
jgi:malonyl-CoA O-methyltransferase